VRTRRNKSVLIIDDDARTREEAVAALDQAQIPVRTVADGSAGLAAIASERPDVIVLELDMRGSMAGKDVVNMIKATMEWVDIPIFLHPPRLPASDAPPSTAPTRRGQGPTGAETWWPIVSTFRRAEALPLPVTRRRPRPGSFSRPAPRRAFILRTLGVPGSWNQRDERFAHEDGEGRRGLARAKAEFVGREPSVLAAAPR
jgi:hypothetical protein